MTGPCESGSGMAGMKVVVVGGGIVGLSAAWALMRAGHQAVVLEQGTVPNPLGSSCDEHRMTRLFYPEPTGYGAMVPEAMAAYETLWSDLGERIIAKPEFSDCRAKAATGSMRRCRRSDATVTSSSD